MNAQTPVHDLTALVVIEEKSALATFTDTAALDGILARVRAHIDAFEGDASTASGRAQIRSFSYAITRSKTAMEAVGKRLAAEAKLIPGKIDKGRRHVETTLDAWRDEVRKPLTDWEAAEEARIVRHKADLDALKATLVRPAGSTEQILDQIAATELISDGADRDEFQDDFRSAKAAALQALREKLAWREQYDAEQAELARLRAEREAREADERKRREAEDAARREMEQKAAIAQAAADAERREREAAERREAALRAEAEAAERRAAEAEQRARAEAAAEARRKEDEERAAAEARERDKAHRAKINRAARAALIEAGLSEEDARTALVAIISGAVPNVKITY